MPLINPHTFQGALFHLCPAQDWQSPPRCLEGMLGCLLPRILLKVFGYFDSLYLLTSNFSPYTVVMGTFLCLRQTHKMTIIYVLARFSLALFFNSPKPYDRNLHHITDFVMLWCAWHMYQLLLTSWMTCSVWCAALVDLSLGCVNMHKCTREYYIVRIRALCFGTATQKWKLLHSARQWLLRWSIMYRVD